MEGLDMSSSCLESGPYTEIENRNGDVIECDPIAEMVDSHHLAGVSPVVTAAGGGEAAALAAVLVEVKTEVNVDEEGVGKRRRGRPARGQPRPPPMKKIKEEDEEEDVCFICFDGGSLVLCDRRGCPKAYHPACIKRDEAFFRSKAKWNCGMLLCTLFIRLLLSVACGVVSSHTSHNSGNHNIELSFKTPQVDFDDKSSWEYLFKVYWIYLKEKLSLTVDDLIQAKNPWKEAGAVACNKSLKMRYGGNNSKVSSCFNIPVGQQESNDSERRTTEQPKLPNHGDSPPMSKSSCDQGNASNESTEWASKDLLEFVAHMKNGDTSVLSQFDVQTLLLDYIKRNNLRDPSKKSQIICDLRLKKLFGKPRVGHFEMLKLLEFHFHIKEDFKKDVIQGIIVDTVLSQAEVGGNNENLLMTGKDKKRKTRMKIEERGPQVNLDEYAAIDVHNINLIYLRRNLMESLVVDSGKFHEKVVGSIVRIRISNNDQKQDMYRLVQVVGTSKAALPYKIGEKTADFVLEILNLDKKETISIDVISNQAFSEDECRRLRQSIKCGLVKRLTVGQVHEKAVALQEVRLNDWLETEVLRLNHLRDRASEKGHKKGYPFLMTAVFFTLRECIEKLVLLKTPEERQRRLHEIPEVHADPKMDPNCDSDQDVGEIDNKKQGDNVKPRYSGFGRKRRESITAQNGDSQKSSGTRPWKKLNTCGQNRSLPTKFYLENGAPSRVVQRAYDSCYEGKDSCATNSSAKPGNRVDSCGSVGGGRNNQAVLRSESFRVRAPETSISSLSAGSAPSANDSETDKLWHYRDPNGKIQGPFCVVQLRKWSTTGYFPPEMRIWCINNEEVDSVLLTDVLNGKFCKVFPLQSNISLPSQGVIAPGNRLNYLDDRSSGIVNTTSMDGNKVLAPYTCNSESTNSDGWGSQSSNWQAPVNKTDGPTGSSSQFLDLLKSNNVYSDHPQVNCPLGQQDGTSLHQGKRQEEKICSSASNDGNLTSHESTTFQTSGEESHVNQSQGSPGQSSGGNSKNGDSNSGFESVARSSDSSDPKLETNIPNLPSPMPITSNGDLEGQAIKAEPSAPLSLPVQDSGLYNPPSPSPTPELSYSDEKADSNMQNLPSPPLMLGDGNKKTETAENKQPASSKCPVQDSGSSGSSASSLVVGGERQCRETADEWSGCSPARAKPSVEEGDSGLGSVTSLKPPELASDHAATPTSKCDQLTPPSPPQPVFNESTWRPEPIEFSTLDEESVSDLLAEVDAMESQCGLASPTSMMYSDDELFQDPNNDCFTNIGVLSHPLNLGRSDALSSMRDITLPRQSMMTDEPLGAAQAHVIDHVKRYSVKSSTNFEVDVETQPTYFSVNKTEAGPNRQPNTSQRAEQKPMNASWGTMQGNMNLGLGGINNVGWGSGLETVQGNINMNWSTSAGFMGSESFPVYGGEKFVGLSDWESSWRRQSIHGNGGGGAESYSRAPPKGQGVCKFYENGNCTKGAFCDYFHP
ncbi:hypothetical protein RHGRI_030586 [Rhododendron griersonianum]|uniref:Zinc finger CCCH domain-containing protein 44 n=1 Tax=Rhododendron griersonianum TaxID=479676 RepID=A0AAV6ITV1_9ERIC|nr:hypothetical protein RHGRI_030586 [Rhododendron griersonianum]